MIEDVLPYINMVEILLCDLCEHYWPVIFNLTAEENEKTP